MPHSIIENFIKEALESSLKTLNSLELFKRAYSKKHGIPFLRNPDIKKVYDQMVAKKEIRPNPDFEQLLINRKIRTQSGVAIVAVLTKSYPCPGKCIYCPDEKEMPKSYLSNEPAVMRAILTKFNPYRQVQARIRALELNGHRTDKIELIVMGGTFSYLPKKYQFEFITECFRAANEYESKQKAKGKERRNLEKNLFLQQKRNESAKHRIVGLTLETRPDYINEKEIENFRRLGCTRVELGVQSIFDDILKKNRRGHLVARTIEATRLLKDAGFKINYHLMPGLWSSTPKKDLQMFKELFSNPDFQPDMIKIYPCVVTKNSKLYELWKKKIYKPLSNQQTEKLICNIKKIIPPYVRITRLIRDIPETSIVAGPNVTNLRQVVQQKGARCNCIRCREVGGNFTVKNKIILDRIDYSASNGKEIFLQYISPDKKKLYALLRLRITHEPSPLLMKVVTHEDARGGDAHGVAHGGPTSIVEVGPPQFHRLHNFAIIREVHTYGKLVGVNQKDKNSPQHIGLGKKLIKEAERIAKKEFGASRIAVISGIGVRGYYRKLGYRLKKTYMAKDI